MKKLFCLALILISFCAFNLGEAYSIDIAFGARINKPVKSLRQIKRRNIVGQSLDYSCGPASLATVLRYYFRDKVTEEEIIKFLLLTTNLKNVKKRGGFSLLDLKNFAKYKGYKVVGYKMDLEYLVSLNKPVLIPVKTKDYNHFVIFRGMKGDRVFLADPARGNMTMKADRFLNLWQDGIGMVVSKPGKKISNAPLKLTKEEKAIYADPAMVRRLFGMDNLGTIYADGEF
jgi:uncharacterized protein